VQRVYGQNKVMEYQISIMKKIIQKILKKAGVQLKEFPTGDLARRIKIINNNKIDIILDVGANVGNYALGMRELGYTKKIISFEPLETAFQSLSKNAKKDPNWVICNYALGDADEESTINVAGGNSESSSLLNMLPSHEATYAESKYIDTQNIQVKKLDSVYSTFCNPHNNVMLKIDTQGYEKNVIDGSSESLRHIKIIQLEMSIVPLYENEMLFEEMISYLTAKDFGLFSLETGYSDRESGQLFQIDGVFVKK